MPDPPILNYTTTVPAHRSAGEVQEILGRSGVQTVAVTYEGGRPAGVSFVLVTNLGRHGYTLPVRVDAVHKALVRYQAAPRYSTREHAEKVAWRIAKDWLEAQLALVRAGLAELPEVMLPYQVTPNGETVYEAIRAHGLRALEAGAPT